MALDVYLDINPGMNRTGCPLDRALATASAIRAEVGERFSGLHMYDGHAGGLLKEHRGDRRRLDAALFPLYDQLLEIDAALGATCTLITAGTPALLSSIAHAGLAATGRHRVSAGTIVLGDLRSFDECPVGLEPAAVVVSRCVSNPTEGVYTLDAGVKALAADAGDPLCQIIGKTDYALRKASEEHLPVECDSIAKGDVLYLVPKHICPHREPRRDGALGRGRRGRWSPPRGRVPPRQRPRARAPAPGQRPAHRRERRDGSFFCYNTTDIFPRDSDGTGAEAAARVYGFPRARRNRHKQKRRGPGGYRDWHGRARAERLPREVARVAARRLGDLHEVGGPAPRRVVSVRIVGDAGRGVLFLVPLRRRLPLAFVGLRVPVVGLAVRVP